MSILRIEVDQNNILARQFTELERKNLPFAAMQAANATAWEIRQLWARAAQRDFDRPTRLTTGAAQYRKAGQKGGGINKDGSFRHASTGSLYAEIYIRDEAFKGTPPAKYLLPQVQGGNRRLKGMEVLLQAKGAMPQGMFAVPGQGAPLDVHGNVRSGVVRQVISQLQAGGERGYDSNETDASRKRRKARRSNSRGDFFALKQRRGRLLPGIYERFKFGGTSVLRSIFVFVRDVRYTRRYDIFGLAERQFPKLMPFFFERELKKALESSKYRGKL